MSATAESYGQALYVCTCLPEVLLLQKYGIFMPYVSLTVTQPVSC